MSKIAVISDIHGDLDALQRALAIIEQERCQKIICLGDVLDSRAENEKILELLKEHRAICVRGNHEDLEHVDHTPTVKVIDMFQESISTIEIVVPTIHHPLGRKEEYIGVRLLPIEQKSAL